MDNILSHFQAYGEGKIITNLVQNHQSTIGTWCEQYIECSTNFHA